MIAESVDVRTEFDRIHQFLVKCNISNCSSIHKDMSVSVTATVTIPTDVQELPIRFNTIEDSFITNVDALKTNCNSIIVKRDLVLTRLSTNRSLHGIQEWLSDAKVRGVVYCYDHVDVLGLALVGGINTVSIRKYIPNAPTQSWHRFDISHHDPFLFQEQLLERGLPEQAQL